MAETKEAKTMDIKALNIYEKMDLITNDLGVVAKGMTVKVTQTSSYKAVSERDVLDSIKPLEHKYRVFSYPFDREIIMTDVLTKKSEYQGKVTETNSQFMRVRVVYRFVNLDKPEEFIDIITYGDGIDTGDKAPGKAMTYADKYGLMKGYKISTGDDPDQEGSPETGYKGKLKKEQKAEPTYPTMTGTKKVANAPTQAKKEEKTEQDPDELISPLESQGLINAIASYKISDMNKNAVLRKYGYDNVMQIKRKHYDEIVKDLKAMI